jgi:uncharacterized protein (TIGR03435 family)
MTFDAVIDHLWQSTIVAAAIALLSLAFRRTRAQTRYWIWFAASLKFLMPFAALTSLGAQFKWRTALPSAPQEWTLVFDTASQPLFAPQVNIALARAAEDAGLHLATVAGAIWLLGFVTIVTIWVVRWRRVAAAVRAGAPITSGRIHAAFRRLVPSSALRLVSSDSSLEPGVFGIARQVLLWPRDIDARLDDAQVHAILAHELAHARRRDNLTAAVHMLVEAIFWFHPLVWWIGARLVDERERACDEEVVRLGSEPHVYAESILKTCQFSIESPLSCVTGVTGSDLKTRIERIMTSRHGTSLSAWSKTLLMTCAAMMVATPVVVGALRAPVLPAVVAGATVGDRPSFEVARVKPNKTGAMRVTMRVIPSGAWEATNVTLESMIRMAYRLQESQLVGGPAWIYSDRFDIVATSEEGALPAEFGRRMQSLLADRFNLKIHNETRDLPIYALVLARGDGSRGPRLTPSSVDCTPGARGRAGAPQPMPLRPGERPMCGTITAPGRLTGGGVTLAQMAMTLSQYTGRMVFDRTAIDGHFDYDLNFTPDRALRGRGPGGGLPSAQLVEGSASPSDPDSVSIFTAVQEQLGLRLDSERGPVDVIVVDSAHQPSED